MFCFVLDFDEVQGQHLRIRCRFCVVRFFFFVDIIW